MSEQEAIYRLNNHFREFIFKDDVDSIRIIEAYQTALQALNNQIWLKGLLTDYYKEPTAVKCEAITHDLFMLFVERR